MTEDSDIFSNEVLFKKLAKHNDRSNEIYKIYMTNFVNIRDLIEMFLSNLADNVVTMPFILRCLCRVTVDLINKKFSKVNKLKRNAFLTEILFVNLILPVLVNPDFSGVVDTNYIGKKNRIVLSTMSKLIRKLGSGFFLDNINYCELTLFNKFFIKMYPKLTSYFDKLIDVHLPDLSPVEKCFFDEHPNELIKLETICFSPNDILFILDCTKDNFDTFRNIPLKNCLKRVNDCQKYFQKLAFAHSQVFYMVFDLKENPVFKEPSEIKVSIATSDEKEVLKTIKFCIRKVLRGISTINPKVNTHFKNVSSIEEMVKALYKSVEIFDKSTSTNSTVIPLSWYLLYVDSNLPLINAAYKDHDFSCLLNEIIGEEQTTLEKLFNKTNSFISKLGMNIRNTLKLSESAELELHKIKKIERKVKLSRFKSTSEILVCVRQLKQAEGNVSQSHFFDFFFKSGEKESELLGNETKISVSKQEKCVHQKLKYIEKLTDGKNPNSKSKSKNNKNVEDYHSNSIDSFAKNLLRYKDMIRLDIENNNNEYKIYQTIRDYMNIVYEEIGKSNIFSEDSRENDTEQAASLESQVKQIATNLKTCLGQKDLGELNKELEKVQAILAIEAENKKVSAQKSNICQAVCEEIENDIHRKMYKE